ncbi:hypothetical protein NDU88_001191 [Pleurodeles waltl]|uniref:Uncharacterized protein n=1 Tax=Pleurodeles waltl TaxID=8319 RepID=A0AAV7MJ18_PLEWA|nr:hypothetical protein NDU88_001191 [Pleurodeles waltl]
MGPKTEENQELSVHVGKRGGRQSRSNAGTEKKKETRKEIGIALKGRRRNPDPPGEKGETGRASQVPEGTCLSQARDCVYGSYLNLLGLAEG